MRTPFNEVIEAFGYDPQAFMAQANIDGWSYYYAVNWIIGSTREGLMDKFGGARFDTDADAEEYVAARAAAGDKRCQDAVAILVALNVAWT